VLREACRANKAFPEQGLPSQALSVNISARQFRNENLVDMVAQVLKQTALDPGCASVANSVIDIAHNLGIKAIAEGVETEGQLHFLHDCNCDIYQGFLFSPPVPKDRFAALLHESPTPTSASSAPA